MVTPRIVVTTDLEAGGMYRAVAAPADPGDNGKLPYAAAGDLAYLAHGPAGYPLVATGSGFDWLNALGDIIVDSLTSVGAIDGPVTSASLPLFGAAVRGAVPPSGGGTTNFMRADGTWAAPGTGAHTHTLADITDEGALAALNTVGTAQIDGDAVTYAKIQNVSAASKLLGRGDSGSGDVQEITLGTNLSMSGTTLNATGGGGTPATTVVAETSYGAASAVGTATNYAREDHTHGTPSLGTLGTTACAGNDARLSDARTPTAHATSHKSGGSDSIKLNEFADPTGSVQFAQQQALQLRIHNYTGADPASPAVGEIWFRTDL